jgi:hypothetical protein
LEPRTIRTKFGGLFLFLPALAAMPFDRETDQMPIDEEIKKGVPDQKIR